jgi:hypothetical protein
MAMLEVKDLKVYFKIHKGQVKVVIDDEVCDDTYYGCLNASTGRFQLIIPDDCCYSSDVCTHCTGSEAEDTFRRNYKDSFIYSEIKKFVQDYINKKIR